jgi:uncharacterized membrane protein (UPF0127 family)
VRRILLIAALGLTALSCGSAQPSEGDAGRADNARDRGGLEFGHGTAIIDMGRETALVQVEVAQSPEQRARGLMGRRSLPPDAGMAFVFFEKHRGGFWMKDTLIPLSIAFFDQDGTILRILDMDPCKQDPCELYDPRVAYWGALEVNQGAFERWGAQEGDVIRLVQ